MVADEEKRWSSIKNVAASLTKRQQCCCECRLARVQNFADIAVSITNEFTAALSGICVPLGRVYVDRYSISCVGGSTILGLKTIVIGIFECIN